MAVVPVAAAVALVSEDQICPIPMDKLDILVAMVADQIVMVANMRREVMVAVAAAVQAAMDLKVVAELMEVLEIPETMAIVMLEIMGIIIMEILVILGIREILDLQENQEILEMMEPLEIMAKLVPL